MINVNELRIGNYVSDIYASESFKAKVKKIDSSRCYYGDFHANYSDLKPIPLTEEILLKCRWSWFSSENKEYGKTYDVIWDNNISKVYTFKLIYDKKFNYWYVIINAKISLIRIDYLHELQNIFYNLTKTELIVEL